MVDVLRPRPVCWESSSCCLRALQPSIWRHILVSSYFIAAFSSPLKALISIMGLHYTTPCKKLPSGEDPLETSPAELCLY